MKINQPFIIDLRYESYNLNIKGYTGDTKSRYIDIKVQDKNIPVDLTGHTLKVYAVKPDGTQIYNDCTIIDAVNGIAELEITTQMLAVPGQFQGQFILIGDDGSKLNGPKFDIIVSKSLESDSAIESTNEFKSLDVTFSKVETISSDLTMMKDNVADIQLQNKAITTPYGYKGPLFTFVDDDGSSRAFNIMKPMFDQKGVKLTFGVITGMVGATDKMTISQLKQLQNEGHEIVSHSKTHSVSIFRDNLPSVANSSIDVEFKDSQQWLKDNGFKGYDTLVYPVGNYGSEAVRFKSVARKYYKYAINSSGSYNSSPCDNMYVNRYQLNMNATTIDTIKAKIDETIANNKWLVFLIHSGMTPTEVDPTYVGAVIDYIQSLNQPIMPFRQASLIKGNAISIGEYTDPTNKCFIGVDGVNNLSLSTFNFMQDAIPTNGMTLADMLMKYPSGVSYYRVLPAQDNITSEGGVLTTYNYGDGKNFSYQTFMSISTNRLFVRKWIDASDTWGAWQEFAKKADNAYNVIQGKYTDTAGNTMNDPISKYPKYKTTISYIGAGATDPATGEGGTLETYRGENYYSFQRYFSKVNYKVMYRAWVGDENSGSWSAWKTATMT